MNDSKGIDAIAMTVRICAYLCVIGVPILLAMFLFSVSSSPSYLAGVVLGGCLLAFFLRTYADNYMKTYAENARIGKKTNF